MHTLYIGNIEKMLPGCLNKQHVNNNDWRAYCDNENWYIIFNKFKCVTYVFLYVHSFMIMSDMFVLLIHLLLFDLVKSYKYGKTSKSDVQYDDDDDDEGGQGGYDDYWKKLSSGGGDGYLDYQVDDSDEEDYDNEEENDTDSESERDSEEREENSKAKTKIGTWAP